MSGIEIIILIIAIVLMAAGVGYYMNYGQPTLKQMKEDFSKNEEVKELAQLAQQLYDKDLRPIVAKKAPTKIKQQVPQGIVEEPTKEQTTKPAKKKKKYYSNNK